MKRTLIGTPLSIGCEKRISFRSAINVHGGTGLLSASEMENVAVSGNATPMEYGPGPPSPRIVVSTIPAVAAKEMRKRNKNIFLEMKKSFIQNAGNF